jgi:hypothetical protein
VRKTKEYNMFWREKIDSFFCEVVLLIGTGHPDGDDRMKIGAKKETNPPQPVSDDRSTETMRQIIVGTHLSSYWTQEVIGEKLASKIHSPTVRMPLENLWCDST